MELWPGRAAITARAAPQHEPVRLLARLWPLGTTATLFHGLSRSGPTDFEERRVKTVLLLVAAVVAGALAWGSMTGAQAVPARVAWHGAQMDSAWSASLPRDP